MNKNKSRPELPDNFGKDGNAISDPFVTANKFYKHFVNIGHEVGERVTISHCNLNFFFLRVVETDKLINSKFKTNKVAMMNYPAVHGCNSA